MEGCNDFLQHVGDGQNLNEVENAEHIEKHFDVQRTDNDILETDLTLSKAQYQKEAGCDQAHAGRGVEAAEDYQNKGDDDRRKRQPQILHSLTVVGNCFGTAVIRFNGADEDEPAGGEGQYGKPGQMQDEFTVADAGDVAGHNHTGDNRTGKFKDMTEPEVDGCLVLLFDRQIFAGLLYNRSRKARAAQ